MKYFKNTELAKLYHVSEKSVRNWIDAVEIGKLDLDLFDQKGKFYIANTTKNTRTIEALVEKGKKYKNKRGFRSLSPTDEFYEMYSPKQILHIISNLSIQHELPVQYTYIDGGADYWDQYAKRMIEDESANVLKFTIVQHLFAAVDGDVSAHSVFLEEFRYGGPYRQPITWAKVYNVDLTVTDELVDVYETLVYLVNREF